MGLFSDTDQDGAGWDNALDKVGVIGGAGMTAVGGMLGLLGTGMMGAATFPEPASPGLFAGGLVTGGAGAALGGAGLVLTAMGATNVLGDAAQDAVGLAGMVGSGISSGAAAASDFLFPPTPDVLPPIQLTE